MNGKIAKKQITKYSFIAFTVIVTSGLIFCVYIISNIFAQIYSESSKTSKATNEQVIFNQATIDQLNEPKTNNTDLPTGRINPFTE